MRFAVGDIVVIAVHVSAPQTFYHGPTGRGTVTKVDDYGFAYVDLLDDEGASRYIDARELRLVSAPELLADLNTRL